MSQRGKDAQPLQDGMPTTRGMNFYLEDRNLQFVCESVMNSATFERARPHLVEMGEVAGGELDDLAAEADKNPPVLRAFDQTGRRVDEVIFHPSYRAMEKIAFSRFGLAALSHRDGVLGWSGRVPQTVKYALSYLFAQSEFGLLCPVNMTDSCARMLGAFGSEELKARYLPHLTGDELLLALRQLPTLPGEREESPLAERGPRLRLDRAEDVQVERVGEVAHRLVEGDDRDVLQPL